MSRYVRMSRQYIGGQRKLRQKKVISTIPHRPSFLAAKKVLADLYDTHIEKSKKGQY